MQCNLGLRRIYTLHTHTNAPVPSTSSSASSTAASLLSRTRIVLPVGVRVELWEPEFSQQGVNNARSKPVARRAYTLSIAWLRCIEATAGALIWYSTQSPKLKAFIDRVVAFGGDRDPFQVRSKSTRSSQRAQVQERLSTFPPNGPARADRHAFFRSLLVLV